MTSARILLLLLALLAAVPAFAAETAAPEPATQPVMASG